MTSKCYVSFWAGLLTWRATCLCKNIHKVLAKRLAHKQHKIGHNVGLYPGVKHACGACHGLPVVGSIRAHFQGLENALYELTLGPSRT